MKKAIMILLCAAVALGSAACAPSGGGTPDQKTVQTEETIATVSTESEERSSSFDPYSQENVYALSPDLFERQADTDYGTLVTDVEYYSEAAGDTKRVNILLPPGYDGGKEYPVLYMIHGWGGDYTAHLSDGSYLHMLYGNMYRDGLAEPMIIVGVDMYTGKLSEKESLSGEEMRAAYDRAVDDIANDLMPFMEANYGIKTGRVNTAVAGVSEGGAKSLCTGFKWLDKIGYIAGFAPDTGVIPTEWYKGTYWNTPYFDAFPQPTDENMPIYLYLAVGSEDPWNIDCTKYYSEVLNEMGVRNQMDYVYGFGHDSDFWRVCMYNYIYKLFK